jgi:predicted dehydrogenase
LSINPELPGEKSQINVAVIGCGYWGPNLLKTFHKIPEANLIACADVREDVVRCISKAYEIQLATEYRKIAEDPTIEAVAVATPASTHYEIAQHCLANDKHVLVEKPFVLSRKEGEELQKLAISKNKVLMAGYVFIYSPAVQTIRKLVKEGALGEIRYIKAVRTSLGPRLCEDTNIVWDALIHEVYILVYILGEFPIKVVATGRDSLSRGLEDVVFATFYFPSGAVANCYNTSYAPLKIREMTFVGSKKMLIYDDQKTDDKLTIYECGYEPIEGIDEYGNKNWGLFNRGHRRVKINLKEPLRIECEHFLECIKRGERPQTDADFALRVGEVLGAADQSLKMGGFPVRIGEI